MDFAVPLCSLFDDLELLLCIYISKDRNAQSKKKKKNLAPPPLLLCPELCTTVFQKLTQVDRVELFLENR